MGIPRDVIRQTCVIGRSVGRFTVRGHGRSVGRSVGRSSRASPGRRWLARHSAHEVCVMASTQVSVDARFVRMRRRGFFTSSVSRGIARVGTSARRDVGTSRREARHAMEGDRRHRRRDPGASVGVRAGRREERRRVTSVDRGTNSMTDDVARALFLDAVRRSRARLHARPRRRQVRRETPRKGITTRPNRSRERRARSRSARGGMKWA